MTEQLSLLLPSKPAEIAYLKLGGRKPILSLSGGADSAAASLYLKELEIDHVRMNMDTVWEKQEHYEYLHGTLAQALGPITEIRAELGFADLVRKKGLFPSRVMRFCTTELKVLPAQKFLNALVEQGEDIVNVVGIRHDESADRAKMPEWEWSDGFDCEVWRPIVRWTKADVWAILKRHGLDPNPLYAMGATRVGCWPCIHARKSEIALVARVDPPRIDLIRDLELELNTKGRERDDAMGRPFVVRSMFSYHGGDSKHYRLPIDDAVEWANSKRGEWQPSGGDGCARFGLCERTPKEKKKS